MAGNSARRGAKRNPGSKKGASVGTGGQRRKGLQGKGPTPKATERTSHPASRRAASAKRAESKHPTSATRPSSRASSPRSRGTDDAPETVSGRNPVVEALRAAVPARTLYVASRIESDERVKEALKLAAGRGLALQVPAYDYAHPADLLDAAERAGHAPLVVALDGVTDPRNLGAVVRSAAGFGAHGVLIPERRAAGMTASAWKTSAGAAARVPVAQAVNLTRQLKAYQEAGCMVIGLAADGEASLPDLDLAEGPLVIVVGSEGKGLSRLVADTCDLLVSIPMASTLESLNAGVAASVTLYSVAQKRAQEKRSTR